MKNRKIKMSSWSMTAAMLIVACGKQGAAPSDRSLVKVSEEESADGVAEGPSMTVEDVVQSFELADQLPDQVASSEDQAAWKASLVSEELIRSSDAKSGSADFQLDDVTPDQREVVDLRVNDTAVKNQGSEGTCTAFATVATMENLVKRFYGETLDISERHHWTTYANYQSTTSLVKASAAPIVSEQVWPYYGSKPSTTSGLGIAKLDSYTTTNLALTPIVASLRKGQPVVIAVGVLSSLMSPKQGGIVQGGSQQGSMGHAIAVTGAIIDSRVPGGGYFIIKNSWGTNWGDKGYGYVAFDYCQRTWCSAYSIADATMYKSGVAVAKPNVAPIPGDPVPTPAVVVVPTPKPAEPTLEITAEDFKIQPYVSRKSKFRSRYFYLTIQASQDVLQQVKSVKYSDISSKYNVINGAAEDVKITYRNLASPAFKTRSGLIETDDVIVTLRSGQVITVPSVKFDI